MNEAINQALLAMRASELEFTALIPRLGGAFQTNATQCRDALKTAIDKLEAARLHAEAAKHNRLDELRPGRPLARDKPQRRES